MKTETKTVYIADDGTKFANEKEVASTILLKPSNSVITLKKSLKKH